MLRAADMERLLWVSLGGAIGSGARYLLSGWVLARLGPGFPWGTLAVNVGGSFLLAFLMTAGMLTGHPSATFRLALGTGVLGGFTTYSTFNYETLVYLREEAAGLAAANVGATVVGCLVAGWLGFVAAEALFGRLPH